MYDTAGTTSAEPLKIRGFSVTTWPTSSLFTERYYTWPEAILAAHFAQGIGKAKVCKGSGVRPWEVTYRLPNNLVGYDIN